MSEDTLTGIHSSMQGPFPFHVGGSESVRPVETGQTIGLSSGPVGADGSAAAPGVPVERGGSTTAPQELIGAGGSAATPKAPIERGSFTVAPLEAWEMSPSAREQGVGSKRSHLVEWEQESRGSSPKRSYRPTTPA